MKATATIIAPLLALLLNTAPNGYTPEELATIFIEPSGITTQDQGTLAVIHDNITVSSHDLADSILGVQGLLATINSLSSPQLFQTAVVSDAEQEAWTLQMELILQQAVGTLDALFFAQLGAVVGDLDAPLTMLARRVVPTFNGTFVREAAVALEEQLHVFPPAHAADGTGISCQGTSSLLVVRRVYAWADGTRCAESG